jgi:hypothetical protein
MIWYLGSPDNGVQANAARGMDVLLSFALAGKSKALRAYWPSYRRILIDSGAYSELNSGRTIDIEEYFDWANQVRGVDAVAGLDDIRGDWRRSLKNYERGGFPTFHDTDPPELLPDLVDIARERGGWIGIGLLPPRVGRQEWLERTLERLPTSLHIHGWALGAYHHLRRLDSIDSTNWWRDSQKILTHPNTAHLTPGEALDIVVKRYQRFERVVRTDDSQGVLWEPKL